MCGNTSPLFDVFWIRGFRHDRRQGEWSHGNRLGLRRPPKRPIVPTFRHCGAVSMVPSVVASDYHCEIPCLRHILIPQRRELHVSKPIEIVKGGVTVHQNRCAVLAETRVPVPGHHVATTAPTNFADVSQAAAPMAHPTSLIAKFAAVSHFSLSTPRTGAARK